MTQSELAGTQITRNMLSCIEHGSAQPSLSTVQYLAERLNVPVGFLLAEEGDELLYQKMNHFGNIKRAYAEKDWYGCRSLCLSCCPQPDDELALLLAECDSEIAAAEFWDGHLRAACRFLDEALRYADATMYSTLHIVAKASVYFRYMRHFSATLYSDVLDDACPPEVEYRSAVSDYVNALCALEEGRNEIVSFFAERLERDSFFFSHIRIRLQMRDRNFEGAKKALLALFQSDAALFPVHLYTVVHDLEICCRETEDFKGAYEYSNEKVALLEELLKER